MSLISKILNFLLTGSGYFALFFRVFLFFFIYILNLVIVNGILNDSGLKGIPFTIALVVIITPLIFLEVYIFWVKILKRPWKTIGVNINSKTPINYLKGFLLSVIFFAFIFGIQMALGFVKIESFAWNRADYSDSLLNLIDTLIRYLALGFGEEIAFRGFIYQDFKTKFKLSPTILLTGIFFSLSHFSTSWEFIISGYSSNCILGVVKNIFR